MMSGRRRVWAWRIIAANPGLSTEACDSITMTAGLCPTGSVSVRAPPGPILPGLREQASDQARRPQRLCQILSLSAVAGFVPQQHCPSHLQHLLGMNRA